MGKREDNLHSNVIFTSCRLVNLHPVLSFKHAFPSTTSGHVLVYCMCAGRIHL